jgi:hypothetical protein
MQPEVFGRHILEREVTFMQDHLVIANFMEGGLEEIQIPEWVQEIQDLIAAGCVDRCAPAGHGFWYVKLDSPSSMQTLLSLPPQHFSFGIILF